MSAPSSGPLVLADSPLRTRLAELSAEAEALRDAVAALDLDIETLRTALTVFDARAQGALRALHARHQRVAGLVRHLERWAELLLGASGDDVVRRGRRLEARRARQLEAEAEEETVEEEMEEAPSAPDAAAELKSLYRRLARRYHPDLARDEEAQCRAAEVMVRINALYRAGDLAGLKALADQALGAEPSEEGLSLEREVALLEARCGRFRQVLEGLEEELLALKACPTARLFAEVTEREAAGMDAFSQLRRELGEHLRQAYDDIAVAARGLEEAVRRYNKSAPLATRGGRAMAAVFEVHTRRPLVRWTLEGLAALRASSEVRRRADWLVAQGAEKPSVARLVLFTYASELVPSGLETLGSLEGLRLRYQAASGAQAAKLEEALVDAVDVLELGVRRAGPRLVQTGLRFRDAALGEAVPLALRSPLLRAEFRRVLATLGEQTRCPACAKDVFAVPLYRLHGLDDLHAWACPSCGHGLKSYWMPRGQDVQSVLNDAFLDLELLTEWTFRLGRASVSMQLLPAQLETLSVGQLKHRFVEDVLVRHAVDVKEAQVRLLQGKRPVPERRWLADCPTRTFSVAFAEGTKVSLADALEQVRYRIRTRFRAEPSRPPEKPSSP
jgi:hypothetical protein